MTFRISDESKSALDELAKRSGRKPAAVVTAAVDAFLAAEAEKSEALERAIAQAEAGETVPWDDVRAYLLSRDTDTPLPMPKPQTR